MDQKNGFAAMEDEALNQVVGGYLEVSKWRMYVTDSVVPSLNKLMLNASANDKAVINSVFSVFQGTLVPGASVAVPIQKLWNDFNQTYRDRLESQNIKSVLGQVIYDAKDYINRNG